jgi:phosphoglycerate kinase
MVAEAKRRGIELVLPVDFKLGDGRTVETMAPGDQQFDIGPKTIALFEQKVGQFIDSHRGQGAVAFYNGVFGMFEDARFEEGTRAFIAQLKRMTDAGIKVYVGGGEGGTALEKYGRPDWVTHSFTAGGTVLNALGSEPVPYLLALREAARS